MKNISRILKSLLAVSLFLILMIAAASADEGTMLPPKQRDVFLFFEGNYELPSVEVEGDTLVVSNLKIFRDLGVSEDQLGVYTVSGHQCFQMESSDQFEDRILLLNGAKDKPDNTGSLTLSLQGDPAINYLYYSPVPESAESSIITIYYQDGTNVWIRENGLKYSYLLDGWRYVLEYEDGWLASSSVYSDENHYPDFMHRLNYYRTCYTWDAYLSKEVGFSSGGQGWFNPSAGSSIAAPDDINLEEMWPFRVITPEGDLLTFPETYGAEGSVPLIQGDAFEELMSTGKIEPLALKKTDPADFSWLSPPDLSESIYLRQPVRFPDFPACESSEDENDFILEISGLGPDGWKVNPDMLKTWQYQYEGDTGSWNALADGDGQRLVLRVPKSILMNQEDDPEVAWDAEETDGEMLKDFILFISPEDGRITQISVGLSDGNTYYSICDEGTFVSLYYSNGSGSLSSSYTNGLLCTYEVYKEQDSSRLNYKYAVDSENCQMRNIYYKDLENDTVTYLVLQPEGWYDFEAEETVTDEEISAFIELCPALTILDNRE